MTCKCAMPVAPARSGQAPPRTIRCAISDRRPCALGPGACRCARRRRPRPSPLRARARQASPPLIALVMTVAPARSGQATGDLILSNWSYRRPCALGPGAPVRRAWLLVVPSPLRARARLGGEFADLPHPPVAPARSGQALLVARFCELPYRRPCALGPGTSTGSDGVHVLPSPLRARARLLRMRQVPLPVTVAPARSGQAGRLDAEVSLDDPSPLRARARRRTWSRPPRPASRRPCALGPGIFASISSVGAPPSPLRARARLRQLAQDPRRSTVAPARSGQAPRSVGKCWPHRRRPCALGPGASRPARLSPEERFLY